MTANIPEMDKYIQNRKSFWSTAIFSVFGKKKFGKFWSSSPNYDGLEAKSYPPKSTFLGDHILAPRGCCTSKFLHTLENDQVLLVHPCKRWGPGSSLQFFKMGVINWLKIWRIGHKNFGTNGSSLMKLCHVTCCYVG